MGDVVDIEVGMAGHTRIFHVQESEVCATSEYLAELAAKQLSGDLIRLCAEDPDLFELFHGWLMSRNSQPTPEASSNLQEPWLTKAAEAWVLSARLKAPAFAEFCLDNFRKTCALAPFGPWSFIEENAKKGSPMRRFGDHWVAWNVSLLGGGSHDSLGGSHEFLGLHAATYASRVDEYTGDPRGYERDHWYSACGDLISPRCDHNPKAREINARNVQTPMKSLNESSQSFELHRQPSASRSSQPIHSSTSMSGSMSPRANSSTWVQ